MLLPEQYVVGNEHSMYVHHNVRCPVNTLCEETKTCSWLRKIYMLATRVIEIHQTQLWTFSIYVCEVNNALPDICFYLLYFVSSCCVASSFIAGFTTGIARQRNEVNKWKAVHTIIDAKPTGTPKVPPWMRMRPIGEDNVKESTSVCDDIVQIDKQPLYIPG